jgi:guanosine-3',5'-bis(diphosphate) 3'-pyrophosphohydrolase
MNDVAYRAMMFARNAHKNQVRKYTGNPYSDHLAEVAGIVATVSRDPVHIAVAWLHDTVENCGVSLDTIRDLFGEIVCQGVAALSDLEEGNRETRKRLGRGRLAATEGWIQSIKCADLISNTSSIVKHDPNFAIVYLKEKRLLLEVMTKADPRLLTLAHEQSKGILFYKE